jgi:anti-anti-sigma factor
MRWLNRYRGDPTRISEVSLRSPAHRPDHDTPRLRDEDGSAFAIHLEPMRYGWVRVRVTGELALDSSSMLERAVEAELGADNHVLLDLSRIEFIDSAGLRSMTKLVRVAKATGRKLRLSADLPAHSRRLLEIVGLLPFVPIGTDDPWSDGGRSLPDLASDS